MTASYEPNLLKTELKGQTVTNIDVCASGTRLTVKTKEGAYIDFDAQINVTPNGIFVELKKIVRTGIEKWVRLEIMNCSLRKAL